MIAALSSRMGMAIALFATLNIGDLVSTWVDLHAGLHEGNPFMNHLLINHGFGALIAYKVLVVTFVGGVALTLSSVRPRLVVTTLLICDLLVFGAITINVLQYPV